MTSKQISHGDGVEEFRKQFETTLTGSWVDSIDSHPGPCQTYRFHPDGTGYVQVSSGMGDDVDWFEWRSTGPFAVEIRFTTAHSTSSMDDTEDEQGEIESPGNWTKHAYDFKVVEYYGDRTVLIWTDHTPNMPMRDEAYFFYDGTLEGTAPGREHFMTPP